MAFNQQRYRQLQYEGTRILEAREVNWTQEIAQGVDIAGFSGGGGGLPVSNQLTATYRQGALFNVTVATAGLTVTLSATNPSLPMLVFVRDRWETIPTTNDTFADYLSATVGANAVFHLQGSETTIYLSWQLFQQTGGSLGTDPTLSDSSGQPTANAAELQLALSTASAVGTVLPGAYYGLTSGGSIIAVNTSLILCLTFTNNGTTLTYVPQDNIIAQALVNPGTSGFVSVDTTHGGSGSSVVATNDARIGAALTSVADGLVHDSTVRTPVAFGGTNADGTTVYKLPINGGSDIGGISAAKVIMISFTQTLEAGWNYLRAAFSALLAAYNAHQNAQLGLANTHPVPTPSQVGAAPSSHVGLPLGTNGSAQAALSHPGVINSITGGFEVDQSSTGAALDPGFAIKTSGTNIASLNHDGDIYSALANALLAANGGGRSGNGVGAMGLMSHVATALTQHVNQLSHANPHGLTASDIGALTSSNFTQSFGQTGWVILPNGLVIQWGLATGISNGSTVPFPISFPHAGFIVLAQGVGGSVNINTGPSATNFKINTSVSTAYWLALGN